MFSIYYMNFNKAYEIKTMLSNTIKIETSVESSNGKQIDAEIQSKIGSKFLSLFDVGVGSNVKAASTDSQKVLDNFQVVMTKSLILNEVMEECKVITGFADGLTEGDLVKINKVKLSLMNENEIRTVKTLTNGLLKGMKLPETGEWDINNIFSSVFKDYSYKFSGKIFQAEEQIMIKIPFASDNEFENAYSVDDLLIGEVSIIGIYKGKITRNQITNTFEFFHEYDNQSNTDEIHSSQSEQITTEALNTANDEYHFFDLVAIIQDIKSKNDSSCKREEKETRSSK